MSFDSVLPTVEVLSKLEPILSNPAAALSSQFMDYSKPFVTITAILTASSPEVDFISRNHLKTSSSLNSWDLSS